MFFPHVAMVGVALTVRQRHFVPSRLDVGVANEIVQHM
jgi:hypothetical protein